MVFIKEILPNPVGRDTDGEWIVLVNTGSGPVDLAGWRISDASGKTFVIGSDAGKLDPGEELMLFYSATRIPLNNDGDTVTLADAGGRTADTLTYNGQVADDEIIIAERFLAADEISTAGPPGLEELALAGSGRIEAGVEAAPLLVALLLAVAAGTLTAFIAKRVYET